MAFDGSAGKTFTAQLRLAAGGSSSSTLSGTATLTGKSSNFLIYDPGGASRTVTLPAVSADRNAWFFISNSASDAGELLNVKNVGGTTILALDKGESGLYCCDGTNWLGIPLGVAVAGTPRADLVFDAATELTIASGTVAVTQGAHTIDTESDAASDALDSLTGGTAEEVIFIRAANAARTVVITHGIGANLIACPHGLNVSLAEATDYAMLVHNGTQWVCFPSVLAVPDFGSPGVKADVIAESTGAAGVTIDGAKILDGHILDSVGFYDGADPTKIARLDAGSVTPGQTRVITMADANVNLADIATQAAQIAALGAENTDGNVSIPLEAGIATSGTWTPAMDASGLYTLTRSAGAATEYYWAPIPIPTRSTASKGIKPTGLDVNYSVGTADATDITFEVWRRTMGANGASPTAAVLFGEDDADYDEDHNTAAERGLDTAAPQLHRAILTDAGTPAYLAADESLWLRIKVIDPGTAVVIVREAKLRFSETLVDLA